MTQALEVKSLPLATVDRPLSAPGNALTPMEMLSAAIQSGATPDLLEKLLALQERWEKNQARKAFDVAIAAAKAEIPVIVRGATGHNSKKYADFAAIARVVDPVISKHGLSYRFRTSQADKISVTCVLSHEAGHSEENTLSGPPDQTGNKNAIQAIGSTLSYLQRYSLIQALGLASGDDDDGSASEPEEFITPEQVTELEKLIKDTGGDVAKFCRFAKVESLARITSHHFEAAKRAINNAAEQRKARHERNADN